MMLALIEGTGIKAENERTGTVHELAAEDRQCH
jgi:hypothetical protein